jgi:hypothetical protein
MTCAPTEIRTRDLPLRRGSVTSAQRLSDSAVSPFTCRNAQVEGNSRRQHDNTYAVVYRIMPFRPWDSCGDRCWEPGLVGILWRRPRPGFGHPAVPGTSNTGSELAWTGAGYADRFPARTSRIPLRPRGDVGARWQLRPDRARRQMSGCAAALPTPTPPDHRDKGDWPWIASQRNPETTRRRRAVRRPSGCRLPGQETTHRHHQSQARRIKSLISPIPRAFAKSPA